ncbi:uncharacterized protein LOC134651645 [Cydia amplana]|uniref:uncharacterized protein LOC134651645 n=1 Tax=Cydia amplana TaxID=1869771 RepID=UPI002FE53DC2
MRPCQSQVFSESFQSDRLGWRGQASCKRSKFQLVTTCPTWPDLLNLFDRTIEMNSAKLVVLVLCSKCVAVNIKRLEVPSLVEIGTDHVILDCEHDAPELLPGFMMKWFFNGASGLVYQWIPPMRPQVIGLLKGKVDLNFRISEEPLQAYRAIKILNPSTHLSGNYTCVVSTFEEEDRETSSMLVYSPGKNFHFVQEKKYVFLVTLTCAAEDLYPRPSMTILSKGNPLKQVETRTEMDSWGMYSLTSTAVVHDDDVSRPWEQFVCLLTLPPANYTTNRTTLYYPGLMPTAYSAAIEVVKPQERHTNKCPALRDHRDSLTISVLLLTVSYLKLFKLV